MTTNLLTPHAISYDPTVFMIMAERLTRRKRIRGGHRASTTNILGRIDNLLADGTDTIDTSKLSQLKLTLEEKLGTLKQLDSKILELTEEDGLVDEIEQADLFKNIYSAMVRIEKLCVSSPTPVPVAPPVAPLTS